MPGFDGTGPMGFGPTGRGFGPCGRGFGLRRGFRGRGWRNYTEVNLTKDEQKKVLEEEKKYIEEELGAINKKLKEL